MANLSKRHNQIDLNTLSSSQGFNIFGQFGSGYYVNSGTRSGYNLAAGDINGDNVTDMIIGGIYTTTVLSGPPGNFTRLPMKLPNISNPVLKSLPSIDLNGLSISKGFTIVGGISGQLTNGIVVVGNINADRYADIFIGGPSASPLSRSSAGMVSVIWGQAQGQANIDLISEGTGFRIIGASANNNAGRTLAVGDMNRDEFQDIVIATNSQKLYVIFGQSTGFTDIDLASFSSDFGFVVSSSSVFYSYYSYGINIGDKLAVIDINKNGYSDMIIGAAGASPLGRGGNTGAIFVISGRASMGDIDLGYLNSETGLMIMGANARDQVGGGSLATADFNGDGRSDIITIHLGLNTIYVLLSQDELSTNHSSVSPSPLVSPSPSPSTSPSSPVVKPCLSYGTSALMTWIETHCHGITKAHQSSMVNALSNNQCQLVMHQSSQYCDTTLSCTLSSQCNPSLTEINLDLSSDAESIYSSGIETAVLASMAMIALDYLL